MTERVDLSHPRLATRQFGLAEADGSASGEQHLEGLQHTHSSLDFQSFL